ncbi:hypothetical protein Tco_0403431 [Tanacetum coccineum]
MSAISDNSKFPMVDEEDSPSDSLLEIFITKNISRVSDNSKFLMVDEEDLIFKKISPMAEEIMALLREGLGKKRDYVRVVAGTNEEDSDSELLIPTSWSDESKNKKGQKGGEKTSKGKDPSRNTCEEEVSLNNNIGKQSGDLVEMPSEAVEQEMDDHVPDEIDGAKYEQLPNHIVKKGNLEFLVSKQVKNDGGDELVEKGRPLKRKRMYAE